MKSGETVLVTAAAGGTGQFAVQVYVLKLFKVLSIGYIFLFHLWKYLCQLKIDFKRFSMQLAKLSGNKVIATCGGSEKAKLLKELGVDRVIDYKSENIKTVLKKEFPKGVNIIYESVGGQMFDMCLNALAVYGRLIVIGMISQVPYHITLDTSFI